MIIAFSGRLMGVRAKEDNFFTIFTRSFQDTVYYKYFIADHASIKYSLTPNLIKEG
jgi:hypothetical protein